MFWERAEQYDAEIKIYDPRNKYVTQGYDKIIYVLPKDAPPGTWLVKTNDVGFNIESRFVVQELKDIEFIINNGILRLLVGLAGVLTLFYLLHIM